MCAQRAAGLLVATAFLAACELPLVGRPCDGQADCVDGYICVDATCHDVSEFEACEEFADCPEGTLCHLGYCLASPAPPGRVPDGPFCDPLPPRTEGDVHVAADVQTLRDLLGRVAFPGDTVLLADGIYELTTEPVEFLVRDVMLRSQSRDERAVVIDSRKLPDDDALNVVAGGAVITELTVLGATDHGLRLDAEEEENIGARVHRVHVADPVGSGMDLSGFFPLDDGELSCNLIQRTDVGRDHEDCARGGGILAQGANGWTVRDNDIRGWYCDEAVADPAIYFTASSRDTVVERNKIIDARAGIQLGSVDGAGRRAYADAPCGGAEAAHFGGIVRNNFIAALGDGIGDSFALSTSAINMNNSCETSVVHNSAIVASGDGLIVAGAITTGALIQNNLLSHGIDAAGDVPTPVITGNRTDASPEVFVDAVNGDLHLASDSVPAINAGAALPGDERPEDFDGEAVSDGMPDQGADER